MVISDIFVDYFGETINQISRNGNIIMIGRFLNQGKEEIESEIKEMNEFYGVSKVIDIRNK